MDGFPGLYFVVGISKPHEHLLEVKDEEFEETVRGMNVYKGRVLGKNLFDKVLAYPNPSDWAKDVRWRFHRGVRITLMEGTRLS